MRFFFDGSLPKRLAQAAKILEGREGVDVCFKHDHPRLKKDTPDVDWIAVLAGERDWAVLSFDPEILRKAHERAAWEQAALTGFFFHGRWGNVKLAETTWRFFQWWPIIKATAAAVQQGATYVVPLEARRKLIPFSAIQRKKGRRRS